MSVLLTAATDHHRDQTVPPTVATGALARIIAAVLPHADPEDDLLGLGVVRLEITPTHVLAIATDRTRLGVARMPLASPPPAPITASLPLVEAVRLLQALHASTAATTSLAGLAEPLHDEDGGVVGAAISIGETRTPVGLTEQPYPNWRAALQRACDTRETTPATPAPAINTAVLHRVLSGLHTPGVPWPHAPDVRIDAHATPMLITAGDWYLAVVAFCKPAPTDPPSPIELARSL